MDPYISKMLREQLKRGPAPAEDFFRMKVTGSGETTWFNITPEQLAAIIEALHEDELSWL
jgi:hypothetical protein